jgi:hypothetical protein
MNRSTAAAVGRAALLLVLAGSGGYVLLYLYRWEWQRAIIAGIFFLASLIVLSTILILRRLDRIERQTTASAPPAVVTGQGAEQATTFAWLEPRDTYGVFIPILLGFGVVVGLVAVAVERLASFVGGGAGVREVQPSTAARSDQAPGRGRRIAAGAVLVALLIGVLVTLRSLTMYVPEPPQPGARDLTVSLAERRIDAEVGPTTRTLLDLCIAATAVPVREASVRALDDSRARITLSPMLDEATQRRLNGCLEDAVLDRRLLTVTDVVDRPA